MRRPWVLIQTFSSNFSTNWYPWNFFGFHANPAAIQVNLDGSVTLAGDTTGPNGELATASPASNPAGFVGTAFGGGGYFEATLKFDPRDIIKNKFAGWPAWWSMALEHMIGMTSQQWLGQNAGYNHFIEVDFFEYDLKGAPLNYYGGALHDWYGLSAKGYSNIIPPYSVFARQVYVDTDFTQYHRYGFLWVPATTEADGYAEYYFDGNLTGQRISWTMHNNSELPPPMAPRLFSIIDHDHLVLILGTGVGEPMTIQSVIVWQATPDSNMKN